MRPILLLENFVLLTCVMTFSVNTNAAFPQMEECATAFQVFKVTLLSIVVALILMSARCGEFVTRYVKT